MTGALALFVVLARAWTALATAMESGWGIAVIISATVAATTTWLLQTRTTEPGQPQAPERPDPSDPRAL